MLMTTSLLNAILLMIPSLLRKLTIHCGRWHQLTHYLTTSRNLDPIGAYDDNGIPVYKRGHVIQLRPVFFREIQLQQALDSLRNGELARATAGARFLSWSSHLTE